MRRFFGDHLYLDCVRSHHYLMVFPHLPSGKLTWQWNIPMFNRKSIFKGSMFHCYVTGVYLEKNIGLGRIPYWGVIRLIIPPKHAMGESKHRWMFKRRVEVEISVERRKMWFPPLQTQKNCKKTQGETSSTFMTRSQPKSQCGWFQTPKPKPLDDRSGHLLCDRLNFSTCHEM